jgi:hypothetical protein
LPRAVAASNQRDAAWMGEPHIGGPVRLSPVANCFTIERRRFAVSGR